MRCTVFDRFLIISCIICFSILCDKKCANADSMLFSRPINCPTREAPFSIFASDLNGDGFQDVIIGSINWNIPALVYMNDGFGNFQATGAYSYGASNDLVFAADLDLDGDNDMIIGGMDNYGGNYHGHIASFFNDGYGNFAFGSSYAVNLGASIFATDLNNDTFVDVAITDNDSSLIILFNNGQGSFGNELTLAVGGRPYCVRGGDLDNDGDCDLAVANQVSNNVSVLINTGNGSFLPSQFYDAGEYPWSITIADFNNDGNLDLAVANMWNYFSPAPSISLLFNCGGAQFCNVDSIYLYGFMSAGICAADFDNDGMQDIAVTEGQCSIIGVLKNMGQGLFRKSIEIPVGNTPLHMIAADINNDNNMDILSANYYSNTFSVVLNYFEIEPPTLPVILSPANGASLDSTSYLIWLESVAADSLGQPKYSIQLSSDSTFYCPEISIIGLNSSVILDESFAIRLGDIMGNYQDLFEINACIYWRVRGDFEDSLSSHWTDGSNWFIYMAQNRPPNAPDSGFSPRNGEEIISLIPIITWNYGSDPDQDDNSGTLSYTIRLAFDSLFEGFVYNDTSGSGIVQIQPFVELLDNTHYFYEVKTIDDGGLSSAWSARQNFWTNHYNFPPEPFPLMRPLSEAKQIVANTHFTWGHTEDFDPNSSFTYSIQFSPDSAFHWVQRQLTGLTDTTISIATDSIALSGRVFWRVMAVDDDNLTRIGGIPEQVRQLIILPPGDANGSGTTTGLDVSFLVNYFKGRNSGPDPLLAGDANGSCTTTGLDVTYLVRFFKGIGPAPRRCGN
jgi:hypothetical protein